MIGRTFVVEMLCLACVTGMLARAEGAAAAAPPVSTPEPPPDPGADAPWKRELERKLQRRVSFQLQTGSIPEATALLRQMTNVNLVLDPELEASDKTVTLSVTDSTVKDALKSIVSDTQSEMLLLDEAVFLFPKGKYALSKPAAPKPLSADALQELQQALPGLSADDFAARENASGKIRALGPAAVPHLKAALDKELDPEAQQRLARLIETSMFSASLNELSADTAKQLQALNQSITFDFQSVTLEDAVTFLRQLSRARLTCAPNVAKQQVTLRVTQMSVGSALKWLAQLSGTRVVATGDGLLLKAAEPADKAAAPDVKK